MGKIYEALDERLKAFIERQHLFFVATAPEGPGGHVNLSPKGLDCFRILGARSVAYQDLTGSGAETIAHLRQNGRITLMFCAFQGPALILRLYGRGEVLDAGTPAYDELAGLFPERVGARSIIRVELERIADSCGFGIPIYDYRKDRDTLLEWAAKKGPEGIRTYQAEKNRHSIDGIPAFEPAEADPA